MRLQPTITFEEYKATYRVITAAKPKLNQKRSWREYVVLAIVCLVLGLAPQFHATRISALTLYAALFLWWVFSKPLVRWSQERQLRRFYSDEQAKLNDQVLTIDELGISCDQGNGQITSKHTWQAFIKRIEMPDAFIFLPSPNSFVRVPKEALTPSDHQLIWEWSSTVPSGSAQ